MSDPIADQECRMMKQALINSQQNLLIREQAALVKAKPPLKAIIQARVDVLAARLTQLLG